MAIETKRGYVTKAEVETYCDINILDDTEAIERIEMAEEIIDEYVGFQRKFLQYDYYGIAESGTTTTLTDTSNDSTINALSENMLSYSVLEIISGTNAGESRIITGSSTAGVVTVNSAFTSAIDSTSVYRIYQLGKFPRESDYQMVDSIYYKYIIEKVKKATLAQVKYMIEMGDDFFTSGSDKVNENIDGYSYTVKDGTRRLVAPKARDYLHGIMNRKGTLIV